MGYAIALIVADSGALSASESTFKTTLEGNGHTVTAVDDGATEVLKSDGYELAVVMWGTTTSTRYDGKGTSSLPVLDMYYVGWAGKGFCSTAVVGASSASYYYDIDNELTTWTGQTVDTTVTYTNTSASRGRVDDSACGAGVDRMLSLASTDTTRRAGVGYDAGAAMYSGTADVRVVMLAMRDTQAADLTAAGEQLIEDLLLWLAGPKVAPTGLNSAATLGAPTLAAGNVNLAPSGLDSAATLGAPTLSVGNVNLAPSGLDSAATLGAPTLSAGGVNLVPSGVDSAATVGAPSVDLASGPQNLVPSGLDSSATLGAPSLAAGNVDLAPSGLDSSATLGAPTLSAGNVDLAPSGLDAGATLGAPALAAGGVNLAPTGLDSSVTIGSPALVAGAVTIAATGLDATITIGAPTLTPGGVNLAPTGLDAGATLGTVTLAAGGVNLAPTGLDSSATLGTPTLNAIAPGGGTGRTQARPEPRVVAVAARRVHVTPLPQGVPT